MAFLLWPYLSLAADGLVCNLSLVSRSVVDYYRLHVGQHINANFTLAVDISRKEREL